MASRGEAGHEQGPMSTASVSVPPSPDRAQRTRVPLLAVVAGVAVANLYYAQPMAAMMADALKVSPAALGVLPLSAAVPV